MQEDNLKAIGFSIYIVQIISIDNSYRYNLCAIGGYSRQRHRS